MLECLTTKIVGNCHSFGFLFNFHVGLGTLYDTTLFRLGFAESVGLMWSEPVFVNLLKSPGTNSRPGVAVGQPYLSYRPAARHLQIRAQAACLLKLKEKLYHSSQ